MYLGTWDDDNALRIFKLRANHVEEEKEKGFPTVGYVIFLCGSYKYEYCKCNCYLSCSVERIGSVCITLAIYIFLYF